ncbi:LOW QUALITY PROTEIN: histamine H3 receptor [Phalacrocorax carbo]|uniref:LOW QUALITY PROTEIN: histamine H3 receptor n=1 Tax=Phalacrocorax carbo TaxID=9209 RepID=UPI003119E84C
MAIQHTAVLPALLGLPNAQVKAGRKSTRHGGKQRSFEDPMGHREELQIWHGRRQAAGGSTQPPPSPAASRDCGGAKEQQKQAGQQQREGRGMGSLPATTGQDLLWLNHSGSPWAAGNACMADGQRGGAFATTTLLAALMGLLVLATMLGEFWGAGRSGGLESGALHLSPPSFCILLYIPYALTGEWRLGRGLCKLWLVADYLVCTASVFNIIRISFDRFISVTKVVSYRAQKGMTRNAVLKMITVWIAAFLLYGPAILSWAQIHQKNILPEGKCHAEFFYSWYFLMMASTIEFFTPFITVIYVNLSIYLNIRKHTPLRNENLSRGQEVCEMNFQGGKKETHYFFLKPATDKHEKRASSLFSQKKASRLSLHKLDNQSLNLNISQDLPPLQVEVQTKPHRIGFYKTTESVCNTNSRMDIANTVANRFRLSQGKRVANSLAIIFCVFGLCWAPYTLLMIIRAACHGQCVQYSLYKTSFWLLWVNSAINPVLHPLCHMGFRKAFIKLICPGKGRLIPHIFM